jgi:hypothetical protein
LSDLLPQIQRLVRSGDWRGSRLGLQRLADHAILVVDIVNSIGTATTIEHYPSYFAGPCILVLQHDRAGAGACTVGYRERHGTAGSPDHNLQTVVRSVAK